MPKKHVKKGHKKETEESEEASGDATQPEELTGWKYSRRQIQSNWDRYRAESPQGLAKDEQIKQPGDFESLLLSPSDCNYFQFKSEKKWEEEEVNNRINGNKFLNLDLEVLASGLACVPFYERVDIDRNILSEKDIELCDKIAAKNSVRYEGIKKRFLDKLEREYNLENFDIDISKIVPKSEGECNVEVSPTLEDSSQNQPSEKAGSGENLVGETESLSKSKDIQKKNLSDGDDLEAWLDGVLDN